MVDTIDGKKPGPILEIVPTSYSFDDIKKINPVNTNSTPEKKSLI
jgi:hypothetical protein